MAYGYRVLVAAPVATTLPNVRQALKDQGFGVLTEIDVRTTLHDRLGEEMEDYVILGACNPPLAHRALGIDRSIGLLLPCNVVVRAATGDDEQDAPRGAHTVVEALDPHVMVTIAAEPELKAIAEDAARRLEAALATVAALPTGSASSS
jgi:Domain of unknown function DUF302